MNELHRSQIEQWVFNLELECSGASLGTIEHVALGGAVLSLPGLLAALHAYTAHVEALEAVLSEADRVIVWESFGLTNSFADRVEALLPTPIHPDNERLQEAEKG